MINCTRYEGIEISYSESGNGKPVVLLHGYLEAKEIWAPLIEELEKQFRVIAIDLPGHGDSGVASDTLTMEFMAGAVNTVIESLDLNDVFMVGHSLGGYVTLAFLELYPHSLAGYSLFHSHPHADSHAAIQNRMREIAVVSAGKKNIMYPGNITKMFAPKNIDNMSDEVKRSKQIASKTSARGIIAVLNGMIARPSRKVLLEKGTKPLLWVLGRDDQYFSAGGVLDSVKVPSNAQVVILEKSGHLGFVEETKLSAEIINNFISKINY